MLLFGIILPKCETFCAYLMQTLDPFCVWKKCGPFFLGNNSKYGPGMCKFHKVKIEEIVISPVCHAILPIPHTIFWQTWLFLTNLFCFSDIFLIHCNMFNFFRNRWNSWNTLETMCYIEVRCHCKDHNQFI